MVETMKKINIKQCPWFNFGILTFALSVSFFAAVGLYDSAAKIVIRMNSEEATLNDWVFFVPVAIGGAIGISLVTIAIEFSKTNIIEYLRKNN